MSDNIITETEPIPSHSPDVKVEEEQKQQEQTDKEQPQTTTTTQHVIEGEVGEVTEVESMCPRCQENGTTRFMLTSIPHFKEIIVSSFECPHCHERNNEVTFGGAFGPKKVRYELAVHDKEDLDRQVVKSEFATIQIPELELEIPPESQRGMLNTIEGVLAHTKTGLELQQPLRKIQDPALYQQIAHFCDKLVEYQSGTIPFTFIIDDPAGNSYIEGRYEDYYHPTADPHLTKYEHERTDIDRQLLGLPIEYNTQRNDDENETIESGKIDAISTFPCICPACHYPGNMNMHECDIPFFKETVIMAFKCDQCGYKSNEVKSGGAIADHGLRLTLHVMSEADLKRDVLKSETATLRIPEVDLELASGTLGGFFSSVEGTIVQVRDQLKSLPQAAFATGDAAQESDKSLLTFTEELNHLLSLDKPFTFILDDPLANVYIQNPHAHLPPPQDHDPQLIREEYVRSAEEDEELGITHMRANQDAGHTTCEEEHAE